MGYLYPSHKRNRKLLAYSVVPGSTASSPEYTVFSDRDPAQVSKAEIWIGLHMFLVFGCISSRMNCNQPMDFCPNFKGEVVVFGVGKVVPILLWPRAKMSIVDQAAKDTHANGYDMEEFIKAPVK
ncbi:hypothetical protein DXG01_004022 [Tephrocybe rancida]|nr:hypothetical protein DXG01_004022 [Tephrocybe rancida]